MGLSSSQGRLLMLTSRLSDIELSEVMISQRQARLAFQAEKSAAEYNEKMNNYKLQIKLPDASQDYGYKKQDVDYENMNSLGYVVTDANKQIYLKKDENGEWVIPKNIDGKDLLSINKSTGKATVNGEEYDIKDGTDYLNNAKVLQNSIINGVLFIMDTNNTQTGISITNMSLETEMEYVLDTSDDAQAQSKYEYETARISRQDNKLDMELQQLETQHNAVIKEYDSVKQVIESNVDRTFKIFSNG